MKKNAIKSLCIITGLSLIVYLCSYSICTRPDHKHVDKHVARCQYTQKDLYESLRKNKDRHEVAGRENACLYCGCPVSEHTEQ